MGCITRTDISLDFLVNSVLMMLLCNPLDAHIMQGQDCAKDFGGQMFHRVDVTLYECWPKGGPIFSCYPGSAIPAWYDTGDKDPCICIMVYSKAKGKRAHICPAAPSKARPPSDDTFDLGANDLEGVRKKVTPHAGNFPYFTASPTTCYMTFQEVPGFARKDHDASFSVGTNHDEGHLGHFIATDLRHCQDLCLALEHCRALQFTPINPLSPQGFCKGFTDFGDKEDFAPMAGATYFIRRGCYEGGAYSENPPATTAAVPLTVGPHFQFSLQLGGELVSGLEGGEDQCRRYCHGNQECVAVDYDMNKSECWWHRTTSCSSHLPAPNRCCNHYKKHILHCPVL